MTHSNNPLFEAEEIFIKVFIEREIDRLELNKLNLALLSDGLNEEEQRMIARIFYGLRRGWLRINDMAL